ncbi:hypothetical protein V8D89_001414 [Ganoderma adspersum]
MPPSSSANNIVHAATPFPITPQSEHPPPTVYMCASCPEFGTRGHYGSSSDMVGDGDLLFQTSSSSNVPSLPSDVEVIQVRGVMVEMEVSEDDSVYRTARVPQVEFTSPREVVFHSISAGGSPSPSRSPSRARALAKLAVKAKGIAKMLSLRRLSRKPSTEAPNPLVSSTSTVAVSGTWRDGAGGSAPRWSQASPRRPPISILVTSESRTDAIAYHMSPSARIMSSSSTTGIYTPDDDEFPHNDDDHYPQSPTPSLTTLGADAVRQLERALLNEDRDVFVDTPSRRPVARALTWNLNGRASDPLPAPNTGTTILRPRSAPPTSAVKEAAVPPTPTPFPNLLRLLLFMPWCITVGATITLFPAHIERVVFSSGYIPAPSPRGIDRFCFWADTARDYACIFCFALLSLFMASPRVAWIACALALARFAWVWGPHACATGRGCCCMHVPERLGEDDMESLALIARGGDMANLVLRQCADHSGLRPSRAGLVNAVTVARDSSVPQK